MKLRYKIRNLFPLLLEKSHAPSLVPLLLLIFSISIFGIVNFNFAIPVIFSIAITLFVILFFKDKKWLALLFPLFLLNNSSHYQNYKTVQEKLISLDSFTANIQFNSPPSSKRWDGKFNQVANLKTESLSAKVQISMEKPLTPGEEIEAKLSIVPIKNNDFPWQFDRENYLFFKGVAATIEIDTTYSRQVLQSHKSRASNSTYSQILKSLPKEPQITASILQPLYLGNKSTLNPHIHELFRLTGQLHFLALSGMHIGVIVLSLLKIFSFFPLSKKSRRLAITGIIWSLPLVIGTSPSLIRAISMASIFLLAPIFRRRFNLLNSLFSVAVIYLVFYPFHLFTVSFQLSFTATLAIILLIIKVDSCDIKNRILKLAIISLLLPFIVFIAVLPITLYHFGEITIWGPIFNLIFTPILSVLFQIGIAIISVSSILPSEVYQTLSSFWVTIFDMLINLIEYFVLFLNIHITKFEFNSLALTVPIIILFLFFITPQKRLHYIFYSALIIISVSLSLKLDILNKNKSDQVFSISEKTASSAQFKRWISDNSSYKNLIINSSNPLLLEELNYHLKD